MTRIHEAVILSAARTAIGSYGGVLSTLRAPELGSIVIKSALQRAGIAAENVEKVIMGNVLSAGLGQAPARQAAIFAGLPNTTSCLTINKMCGSGLKAVMLTAQSIALGDAECIVAGGMESMSNAPYLLDKARFGYRMGDGQIIDSMVKDGLWDVYNDFHMGNAAEMCVKEYKFTREEQDAYAKQSYERALKAQKENLFKDEIVPVTIKTKKGDLVVEADEEPGKVNFEKMAGLKPVFEKDGTITAANASTINDGAAAVVVTSSEFARKKGLKLLARIVAYSTASKAPEWFTTAPIDAIQKALKKADLSVDAIDLFEINEAFAAVVMAANKTLKLDMRKVNITGGAVALGHPIGASGARILTTLLYNLKRTAGKFGLASLCIGGGEAVALVVEML
jgi:acetyl-CoA C-acetyltransferase